MQFADQRVGHLELVERTIAETRERPPRKYAAVLAFGRASVAGLGRVY